jgi:hypothetical protein
VRPVAGGACNLPSSPHPRSLPVAGFTRLPPLRIGQFTLTRFVASRPLQVTPGALRGSLLGPRRTGVLMQPAPVDPLPENG